MHYCNQMASLVMPQVSYAPFLYALDSIKFHMNILYEVHLIMLPTKMFLFNLIAYLYVYA